LLSDKDRKYSLWVAYGVGKEVKSSMDDCVVGGVAAGRQTDAAGASEGGPSGATVVDG